LTKLQRLQNRGFQIITNSDQIVPVSPNYCKLGILKIPELYKLEVAKLVHQHSKQILPHYLSTLFKPLAAVHERITRAKSEN